MPTITENRAIFQRYAWPEAGDEWSHEWGSSHRVLGADPGRGPQPPAVHAGQGAGPGRDAPTESARAAVDVPPEDRASEPVVEPLMVAQQRNAIMDRQMAEGEEPHSSNASD